MNLRNQLRQLGYDTFPSSYIDSLMWPTLVNVLVLEAFRKEWGPEELRTRIVRRCLTLLETTGVTEDEEALS